jgi:hypothetical protein
MPCCLLDRCYRTRYSGRHESVRGNRAWDKGGCVQRAWFDSCPNMRPWAPTLAHVGRWGAGRTDGPTLRREPAVGPWATSSANRSDTSSRRHHELASAWCSGVGTSLLHAHQTRLIQRSHASTTASGGSATTVRSDSGTDQTTGDAARGVSLQLRRPVWAEYEVFFGERDDECTAFGRETTPEPTLRRGRRASGRPVKPNSRRENRRPYWDST